MWDWRSGQGYKGLVRKYGGCVGAVKEISTQPGNKHFAAVGLDRFHIVSLFLNGLNSFQVPESMGAWKGGKDREAQNLPEISLELRSHDQVCVIAT